MTQLWPGQTIVCLGTGPSLTAADVACVRGRVRVIAINDAYRIAPWADVLYACDEKWWKSQFKAHRSEIASFGGLKCTLQPAVARLVPDVVVFRNTGVAGLEMKASGLRNGRNSGYQAINLAVHLGAARVLLLGYDMAPSTPSHFFGEHPDHTRPLYRICLQHFETMVAPLRAAGVDVINCSRKTALRCFPCASLEDALKEAAVAA